MVSEEIEIHTSEKETSFNDKRSSKYNDPLSNSTKVIAEYTAVFGFTKPGSHMAAVGGAAGHLASP